MGVEALCALNFGAFVVCQLIFDLIRLTGILGMTKTSGWDPPRFGGLCACLTWLLDSF